MRLHFHSMLPRWAWGFTFSLAALALCCGCAGRAGYDSLAADYVQAQQSVAMDAVACAPTPPASSVETMKAIFGDMDTSQHTAFAAFCTGILDASILQAENHRTDLARDRSELVTSWTDVRIRSAEAEAKLIQLRLEEELPWICRLSWAGRISAVCAVATALGLVLALSRVLPRRLPRRFSRLPRLTMFLIIPSLFVLAFALHWIIGAVKHLRF